MSARSGIGLRLLFALALVSLARPASGQPAPPDLEEGPLLTVAEPMRQLIRLRWSGRDLRLRQDWEDPNANKTQEELRQERIAALVAQGVPEEHASRLADRERFPPPSLSPLGAAFNAVSSASGRGGHSGRTGTGRRKRLSFDNPQLSGVALEAADEIRFQFDENTDPHRSIVVRQNNGGQLSVRISADDLLVELRQSDRGIRLVRIASDAVDVWRADDFLTLIRDQPDVVRQWLFPLLEQLGIRVPLLDDDPTVRRTVVECLRARFTKGAAEADEAMEQLSAADDTTRDTATLDLVTNYRVWGGIIKSRLIESEPGGETHRRLEAVVRNEGDWDVVELIQELRLLDAPDYLIRVMATEQSPAQKVIAQQLEFLTGQDFGEDTHAWQEWLTKSAAGENASGRSNES